MTDRLRGQSFWTKSLFFFENPKQNPGWPDLSQVSKTATISLLWKKTRFFLNILKTMPHCFGAYWCQASIWTEIFELKSVFFPDHPLAKVSMNLITFFVEVLSVYNPDARRPTSSYIGRARASTSTALRLSLPNLTCVTFRVFSSLKCDWKRKTMHWSSLDSVLLSALQRKCVGKMGRGKINHIYITLSGWFKKKKPRKTSHRCLAVTNP